MVHYTYDVKLKIDRSNNVLLFSFDNKNCLLLILITLILTKCARQLNKTDARSSEPKKGDNRFHKIVHRFICNPCASIIRSQVDPAMGLSAFITHLFSIFYKTDENSRLIDEEVDMLFELIGLATQEVVEFEKLNGIVYEECNLLESSLRNTRRGMKELNKLARGIVLCLILIVWLLMMKVLSTQAVALILSQIFVLAFMFGDTCKRIFEGIIFVFVTSPFDIGDRCLIEGREDELFVKEINIQTTVFSRDIPIANQEDNKEKIVYPNYVLAGKHICNFGKIPKPDMTDSVKFVVDASTSPEQIDILNHKLGKHIKEKVSSIKDISLHAKRFEDEDNIKMGVDVTYKDS